MTRGSNQRPLVWESIALPTEPQPLPLKIVYRQKPIAVEEVDKKRDEIFRGVVKDGVIDTDDGRWRRRRVARRVDDARKSRGNVNFGRNIVQLVESFQHGGPVRPPGGSMRTLNHLTNMLGFGLVVNVVNASPRLKTENICSYVCTFKRMQSNLGF